jgi:hypothetical protein
MFIVEPLAPMTGLARFVGADYEQPLRNPVREELPTIQKLSCRDPHRKASQPAVALMLYTQQF